MNNTCNYMKYGILILTYSSSAPNFTSISRETFQESGHTQFDFGHTDVLMVIDNGQKGRQTFNVNKQWTDRQTDVLMVTDNGQKGRQTSNVNKQWTDRQTDVLVGTVDR